MKDLFHNRWIRIGTALVVIGWGPLLTIIALASIGLWPDPNPNPVGPGLLFFFTAWPAIICLAVGFAQVKRRRQNSSADATLPAKVSDEAWPVRWKIMRGVAGVLGVFIAVNGLALLLTRSDLRGGASAIVIGVAAIYWSLTGKTPHRLFRD